MRAVRIAALVFAGVALAACELFPIAPSPGPQGIVRGVWLWPTPAPLPEGAVAVPIDVTQPFDKPPDAAFGCPDALLGSIIPEYRAGDPEPVRYRSVDGELDVRVRWPAGFSARLNPELEIVAPDGTVVGRQGVPTAEFGGGFGVDDRFGICLPEYSPRRIDGPGG